MRISITCIYYSRTPIFILNQNFALDVDSIQFSVSKKEGFDLFVVA